MRPPELLELLQEVRAEKLSLNRHHEANARRVGSYEFNNAYQYIIAREYMHLSWLRSAIEELGGRCSEPPSPEPGALEWDGATVLAEDGRQARAFVDRWRARVEGMTHARHRRMVGVVLGETLEHKRLFEQASQGRADLLGRRPADAGTGGGVLSRRWMD